MAVPRPVREETGISWAFRRWTRPRLVKKSRYEWAVVWMRWVTVSASFSRAPATPLPPRPWDRNSWTGTVLAYPDAEMVNTKSSSSMRSSISTSPGSISKTVRRGGGELLLDLRQLVADDLAQPGRAGQDGFQLGDEGPLLVGFGHQGVPAQPGEAA